MCIRDRCYTTSYLKDICLSGTSEGNQVRCYSLRITPKNASKRRRNLEEIDSSAVKLPTYFGSMYVLPLNLLNCVNSNPVTNVTQAKNKHQKFKQKPRKQTPCHSLFSGGIICTFAVQIGDHLRFRIICGRIWGSFPVSGSFAVGHHLRHSTKRLSAIFLLTFKFAAYASFPWKLNSY